LGSDTTYDNDQVLLRQVAEGDVRAFNELFARYRNRMYSYFVKATKSKELAEEATLDVFLKIWNARSVLGEIEHFEAFLFRVVHNQAIDYIRRAAKSKRLQQELWVNLESLASGEAADQRLLSAEAEAQMTGILRSLSPQRREVFRLSREEFLSYDEIAERMQLSCFTVRNHVAAALQFIRENLDKGPELACLIILSSKFY
jgi:RNA polymerase sigma-70 factor (family 1)